MFPCSADNFKECKTQLCLDLSSFCLLYKYFELILAQLHTLHTWAMIWKAEFLNCELGMTLLKNLLFYLGAIKNY